MKKLFALALILLITSLAFAAETTIIKYQSNSVSSHACDPKSVECAYNFDINVPLQYQGSIVSGTKILSLSDNTNAHAETNITNYYSTLIYMKNDIFTSNTCKYSSNGQQCSEVRADYYCLFGLSDLINAHLSRCNTFGTNEIKLCCAFTSGSTCPEINLSINKVQVTVGEQITFTYSCPTIIDISNALDLNIIIMLPEMNIAMIEKKCYKTEQTLEINSNQLNLDETQSKQFKAFAITSNGKCTSNETPFVVTIPGGTPINPGQCLIDSINAKDIKLGENVNIVYKCLANNIDSNIIIFDDMGNIIKRINNLTCQTTKNTYSEYKLESTNQGNYRARIATQDCYKDDFFSVTNEPTTRSAISDNNPYLILLVLISIITIIILKKK
ncbi:MAG: hypothetical protein WCW13_04215 [archaeon]|jgi:hypothetical protein